MKRSNAGMSYAERVALYEKLIATHPKIERKGAANAYTAMNGNMFSLLRPTGEMALRLPMDEREKFLKKYKTKLYEAYGAVMTEYVAVPDALLGIVGPGVDMGREIADAVDLIPRRRKRCLAEGGQVKPTVRRAFEAAIVEVEAVDVDVGSHP